LAAQRHEIPPFVDGSCRREPDFQSQFPSITATCRAGKFAPRLRVGDRIAYLTVRGRYLDSQTLAWRFVAVLRVTHRFDSHQAAAEWFRGQSLPLPSNCFVEGNPPMPFELTNGNPPPTIKAHIADWKPERVVRLWDASYRSRIASWPAFLVTRCEFLELRHPPEVRASDFLTTLGKIPATLNPPIVDCRKFSELLSRVVKR
jgi:hypothetical protein